MPFRHSLSAVLLLLGCAFPHSTHATPENAAQGNCRWALDPFFGTYDMDFSKQVNMVNFTNGIIGIPEPVVLAGERQIFEKTIAGEYQQSLLYSNSTFDKHLSFICGEERTITIPNAGITLTYNFTMVAPTILRGHYIFSGNLQTEFVVTFDFKVSGDCSFFDTVDILSPRQFTATAPFRKTQGHNWAFTEILSGLHTFPFYTWYCAFIH